MGKASRRRSSNAGPAKAAPAPYVARPFAGLPGESDWVAMREIVPAATATVRLRDDGRAVTVATALPMGWPGLHRDDGALFVALQSGTTTGDASRDVAGALEAIAQIPAGTPLPRLEQATAAAPRLQDVLDLDAPFDVTVHEGFDFWVKDPSTLDAEGRDSLDRANESITPTVKLDAAPSAYWCRVGVRTYLRWVLACDEDTATAALARLHARGAHTLAGGTRFLGAFRACGLLVPVWDLDPALEADAWEAALAALAPRLDAALADDRPLDATQRRSRAGLVSRQLTLR